MSNEPENDPNHDHCRTLLGSLSDYIDGELAAEICSEIDLHIGECENCRVVVDTLRKTVDLYHHISPEPGMPDAVRERLFYRLNLEEYLLPNKQD